MNKLDSLKRKIKYRSEYRGTKEMDLLLGTFVKKYVDTLSQKELMDLYQILEIEDEIISKWYFEKKNRNILEVKISRKQVEENGELKPAKALTLDDVSVMIFDGIKCSY